MCPPLGTKFFFVADRPEGPPKGTTNRATNRQRSPTASGDQPPTANHCQPPITNRRQPPPTATNLQLPTTNRQSLPTANRQSPPTANRQLPPTMVEHMSYPRSFCKTAGNTFLFHLKDPPCPPPPVPDPQKFSRTVGCQYSNRPPPLPGGFLSGHLHPTPPTTAPERRTTAPPPPLLPCSGAGPQHHDASGWGSPKRATFSRWHHEQAPHLLHFRPPSPPIVGGQPTSPSAAGEPPPRKANKCSPGGSKRHRHSTFMPPPPPPTHTALSSVALPLQDHREPLQKKGPEKPKWRAGAVWPRAGLCFVGWGGSGRVPSEEPCGWCWVLLSCP